MSGAAALAPGVPQAAGAYGDFAALEKLKANARTQSPQALRQVARQFESLFARMMIHSMRKAIGSDPIFGSEQQQMYQGLFDDQMSLELTRGRGLGLADMLVRQLQGAAAPAAGSNAGASAAPRTPPTASGSTPAADRARFVQSLWPQAQAAAGELGVSPVSLISQAALETHWGEQLPQTEHGGSSHNYFGIKTGSAWRGAAVSAATTEYHHGSASLEPAAFRRYTSAQQGFQDYVELLKGNPRFRAALGSGNDVHSFATALQQGGYATDPEYAQKVTRLAREVADLVPPGARPVKFAGALPITPGTAAL